MANYFRNDITVRLDFEPHKEILGPILGETSLNNDYNTRLTYNQRNPEYLELKIYYEPSERLFEKLKFLENKGISILSTIKQEIAKQKWNFPEIFDFSKSNLIEITESNSWEHNKKPLILILDNLDILQDSRYVGDGSFKLTKNIFQHLMKYFRYGSLGNHRYDDKFIEDNLNEETTFGPVTFILSFQHSYEQKYEIQYITILRDAYITLTDKTEELTDSQLIDLGTSLCLLMSFYWEKPIEYFYALVRINNIKNYGSRQMFKYSNHEVSNSQEFLLENRFNTFYDFVKIIDYDKYTKNKSVINELIPRILKVKHVDDISAFMILYNIIEKIRNYFLSNPISDKKYTIKEEFEFKKEGKATDKFIKEKIKEIGEIVAESDLDEFNIKASDKVNFIRKTGLKEQFDSLLTYLELEKESYNIDFSNLITIRNSIYHGNIPNEDVKPFVEQMKIITYDIILKMISN